MTLPEILMQDYDYDLPADKIAQQALEPRDSSRLLIHHENKIRDAVFKNIPEYLPAGSTLFYNDAKVIPARIFIKKESGTTIEIFLLKPFRSDYFSSLNAIGLCEWECLVGNKRKWKEGEQISTIISVNQISVSINLSWTDRENNTVELAWDGPHKFIDLLEQMGKMPLPPYIKREAELNDKNRYQTVYSHTQGSVAAPTAGLHFTENVIRDLKSKGIRMHPLTLHVSAGTFLPVSAEKASEHSMHQEIFSVNRDLLEKLRASSYTIAVGTTSVRVLESLYWCAMNILQGNEEPFLIEKLRPYTSGETILTAEEAIATLLKYMDGQGLDTITGATSIMLMPGYNFRFIKGLITNFHQPKSTLILLIAAFIGPQWHDIYDHARNNNYRFLSYGDSSLLLN